jgi:hypothetical protein
MRICPEVDRMGFDFGTWLAFREEEDEEGWMLLKVLKLLFGEEAVELFRRRLGDEKRKCIWVAVESSKIILPIDNLTLM